MSDLSLIAQDELWMIHALTLADKAESIGEVPVGAVIVLDNQIIGEGYNRSIIDNDPCGHAEIMAIQSAAQHIDNYRILDATIYVTLEPCAMCAGAIVHARIKRAVFGASDHKTGCAGSILNLLQHDKLNHQVEVQRGVKAGECSSKISAFFKGRRAQIKALKQANKAAQEE